jgi:hypothetical protein
LFVDKQGGHRVATGLVARLQEVFKFAVGRIEVNVGVVSTPRCRGCRRDV